MGITKSNWSIGLTGDGQKRPHDGNDIETLLLDFVTLLKTKGHKVDSSNLHTEEK